MDNRLQNNFGIPVASSSVGTHTRNMYILQVKPNNAEGPLEAEAIPLNMLINERDAENEQYLISVLQAKPLQLFIDSQGQVTTNTNDQYYELPIPESQNSTEYTNSLQIINNLGNLTSSPLRRDVDHTNGAVPETSLEDITLNSSDQERVKKSAVKKSISCQKSVVQRYVHIKDRVVPPRAVAVLPSVLQLRREVVSPRRPLPPARFGPVEGISKTVSPAELETLIVESASSNQPIFLLKTDDQTIHIDVSDKDKSNWLSLLPLDQSRANLYLHQEGGTLCAVAPRPLPARAPLALGYSREYAALHGLAAGPAASGDAGESSDNLCLQQDGGALCAVAPRPLPARAPLALGYSREYAALHGLAAGPAASGDAGESSDNLCLQQDGGALCAVAPRPLPARAPLALGYSREYAALHGLAAGPAASGDAGESSDNLCLQQDGGALCAVAPLPARAPLALGYSREYAALHGLAAGPAASGDAGESSDNLCLQQDGGALCAVAPRPLPARAPLALGYSREYAALHGLAAGPAASGDAGESSDNLCLQQDGGALCAVAPRPLPARAPLALGYSREYAALHGLAAGPAASGDAGESSDNLCLQQDGGALCAVAPRPLPARAPLALGYSREYAALHGLAAGPAASGDAGESSDNLCLQQDGGALCAVAPRPLPARAPLALGYSREYAALHGLAAGPAASGDAELAAAPRQWWCGECQRPLSSAALLQRHMDAHHTEEKQRAQQRYRCRHCTRTFSRMFTLRRHVAWHCTKKVKEEMKNKSPEPVSEILDSSKPADMPELTLNSAHADDSRLPSDESLQTSLLTSNLDFSTNLFDTDRMPNLDISGSSKSDDFNPYSLGFKDDIGLVNGSIDFEIETDFCSGGKEIKTESEESLLLNCRYCNQTIVRGRQRQHVRNCEGRKFQCECGRAFPYKEKLALHIRLDHADARSGDSKEREADKEPEDLQYKCETCKHTFKRRGMLVNHLWRVHKNTSPAVPLERRVRHYPCGACPKLYRAAAKRDRHARAHHPGIVLPGSSGPPAIEGGRRACSPAACAACPRQYATRAKLLQHVRAHHPLLAPPVKRRTAKRK